MRERKKIIIFLDSQKVKQEFLKVSHCFEAAHKLSSTEHVPQIDGAFKKRKYIINPARKDMAEDCKGQSGAAISTVHNKDLWSQMTREQYSTKIAVTLSFSGKLRWEHSCPVLRMREREENMR